MLTGLLFFWSGIKKGVFGENGLPPENGAIDRKVLGLKQGVMVPILATLSVPLIAYLLASYESLGSEGSLLEGTNMVNLLFYFIGIAVVGYMAYVMVNSTPDERKKLLAACLFTFFMTIFWGFHELSGSVIGLFASRNVDLEGIMTAAKRWPLCGL